ncbi:hypothetical protein GCM10027261_14230 [Geodermatophilus arenarius]|uniref:Uncharacterized protein n=1 Tax=Geodermatophilus arenarius TaxID=1137990 RepID=A0ABV9LKA8_9ACTN
MLDDFIAQASVTAGPEAWGHTTSVQLLAGGTAMLIFTDWTPATVDRDLANAICGAAYQWRLDAGAYSPAANVSTIGLYSPEEVGGEQVFSC